MGKEEERKSEGFVEGSALSSPSTYFPFSLSFSFSFPSSISDLLF